MTHACDPSTGTSTWSKLLVHVLVSESPLPSSSQLPSFALALYLGVSSSCTKRVSLAIGDNINGKGAIDCLNLLFEYVLLKKTVSDTLVSLSILLVEEFGVTFSLSVVESSATDLPLLVGVVSNVRGSKRSKTL